MKITKEWLKSKHICKKQYDIFVSLFPDGAELDKENILKAVAAKLDMSWFAMCYCDELKIDWMPKFKDLAMLINEKMQECWNKFDNRTYYAEFEKMYYKEINILFAQRLIEVLEL